MSFLEQNSIYVTLIIAVVVMIGVVFYVNRVDGKLRKLEREVKES